MQACQKVLEDETEKTMFSVNMEQTMMSSSANSGKKEQQNSYMQGPLEVVIAQMRLAKKTGLYNAAPMKFRWL